ncbi:MAG: cobalt ECF transporter T component CbiQ [Eubacteriales bacterium]|nr:cobalt ECF transporter T component CbiQ [Eubacteriales bacterium]
MSHSHKHHGFHHKHDTGGSAIDFYAVNSKIRFLSPGFKAGVSMLALLLCLILDNPWVSVTLILSCALITTIGGGLSVHDYLSVLTIPAAFVFIGCATIVIDFSSKPAGDYHLFLHWGYLYLTRAGIKRAVFLMLRVFGAVSCTFLMTLSTPAHELFSLTAKLPIPTLLTEMMQMIYRYIFILLEVQRNMRISAESRLGFRDMRSSYTSFGLIAANLFIVALKKANRSYDAMEARCYDGTLAFWEEEKHTKPLYLCLAALFFIALLILWYATR